MNTSATYSQQSQYGVHLVVYTASSEPLYVVVQCRVRVEVRYR